MVESIPSSSNLIALCDNKILLLKRARPNSAEFRKWGLVGGGIEEGEDSEKAVHREVMEEIGCEIKWLKLFKEYKGFFKEKKVHAMYYFGEVQGTIKLNDEHSEYVWFSFEEIKDLDVAFNQKEILMEFIKRGVLK
jgi:8-oxo-dGTP pyrophosphatase MutT (NUDIX family)